jgi:hypothetical protein
MPSDSIPQQPAARRRQVPRRPGHGRTRSLGAAVSLALAVAALTASTALGANPAQLTITTSQEITGSAGPFTTSPLNAKLGQSVDYETVVKDTGTTTLTLSGFIDKGCQGITGGPSGALAPGESATYTCQHPLSKFGEYKNHASVTATPPSGQDLHIKHSSKTVVVAVPAEPAFTIEAQQKGNENYPWQTEHILDYSVIIYYKVIVTDTGNTNLTLGSFTDQEHEIFLVMEEGTVPCEDVTGGSSRPLLPGQQTTYECRLNVPYYTNQFGDKEPEVGAITSTATITGTPPKGEGLPITNTSNELSASHDSK